MVELSQEQSASTADRCARLIGPAIKFHHGKVNTKLPGSATQVKFHQDFPFQPMTNDDVITAFFAQQAEATDG